MAGSWVVHVVAENEEDAEAKAFRHIMSMETSRFRFRRVTNKEIEEQGMEHT